MILSNRALLPSYEFACLLQLSFHSTTHENQMHVVLDKLKMHSGRVLVGLRCGLDTHEMILDYFDHSDSNGLVKTM